MEKKSQSLLDKIKDSESLSSIGFGLIVLIIAGIMLFNYFKSSRNAQVSQQAESTSSAEMSNKQVKLPTEYTVAKGDKLWKIAENYYQSGYNWVDIAKANKLANPGDLTVGMKLTIPDVKARQATATSAVTAISPTVVSAQISGNEYTVVKGDCLWKIAVRAYGDGYAWTKIYKANPQIGKNPGLIYPNTKLSIPR